ncbi:MAG: hypothetical protein ABH837_00890 [bacterium]
MILIINNLQHQTTKLWLYSDQPIYLKDTQEYTGNNVLGHISKFIENNHTGVNQINYLGVIQGDGSFTGVRSAVNIANVYAMYNKSIVFDLKQTENNLRSITDKIKNKKPGIIYPKYSNPPRITKSK